MCPGPGRGDQRATRSRLYVQRSSSTCPSELQGPGEPGRCSGSPPSPGLGAVNTSLLWELREFLPACLGDLDWSSRGRNLSGHLVESLVSEYHLRVGLTEMEEDAFMGALGVDRMEDHPVVEMGGDMKVVDAEFKCRD